MKKGFIVILAVLAVLAAMLVPLYSCQDTTDETGGDIADLIEKVNELLASQVEVPGAEPGDVGGDYYVNTSITVNIIINVVPGINAKLEAFSDQSCTVSMEEWTNIGNVAQGILAHEAYLFYVKNTGDVDLTVHLSTGSTPFGKAVLIASPELTDSTFTLPVGEVQELSVIVSVNYDTELGSHSFPCFIVAETTGA